MDSLFFNMRNDEEVTIQVPVDTFLSEPAEVHMAAVGGAIAGLFALSSRLRREFRQQPHYLIGGIIFVHVLGWLLRQLR